MKQRLLSIYGIGLLNILILFTISTYNIFYFISQPLQDSLYSTNSVRKEIVIVQIDEKSLSEIGAWPWPRSVFARLVQNLSKAQVRSLAFDVLFLENRVGDEEFIQAIKDANIDTVLATKHIDNTIIKPREDFFAHGGVKPGFVNLPTDFDSKVRSVEWFYNSPNASCTPSFALQAAASYLKAAVDQYCNQQQIPLGTHTVNTEHNLIHYYGTNPNFQRYSLVDIINPKVSSSELQDKLVFVGSTVQDLKFNLQDNILTPFGLVPGVEVQASIASQLLDGISITQSKPPINLALITGLCVLGLVFGLRLKLVQGLVAVGILGFGYYFVVVFAASSFYWLNIFYPLIALGSGWFIGFSSQYIKSRTENRFLKRAFAQYTDEKLLQKVLLNPNLQLGGQKKYMSVLFSDIRNFTALSESLPPSELVKLLNIYLTSVTKEIFAMEGIIDKYIGDAVLALWNSVVDDPLHAYKSCKAAVRLIRNLKDFNTENAMSLNIGVAVNTGEMVVGNMGSQQRFDYTVIGDNVNLAARLEGLTKIYQVPILIGENTVQDLVDTGVVEEFRVRKLDTIKVKGKSNAIDVYELSASSENWYAGMKSQYERAFQLYQEKHFLDAKKIFDSIYQRFQDYPSKLLSERCSEYMVLPLVGWDGSYSWSVK
jgi:adenylate cyclase